MIRLNRDIPFVNAVLSGDVRGADQILQAAERRHGLRFATLDAHVDEDQRDEWYVAHLWPFLSETHMILSAGDLLGRSWILLDTAGIDRTPTWREWGRIVADWANRHWTRRPGVAARPWHYMDFYMDLHVAAFVDGYAAWRDAVLHVLKSGEGRGQFR
jgi:hypothetical protein